MPPNPVQTNPEGIQGHRAPVPIHVVQSVLNLRLLTNVVPPAAHKPVPIQVQAAEEVLLLNILVLPAEVILLHPLSAEVIPVEV